MTPSYSVPVLPPFQTQEQQDVLENLKHELATSRQELQGLHSSLETSAQVSHSPFPSPWCLSPSRVPSGCRYNLHLLLKAVIGM